MKYFHGILIILTVVSVNAQINQKYGLGQLCAVGNGVEVFDNHIHVAGIVCAPYNSGSFVIRSTYSVFDKAGNQTYFDFVGDTLQQYELESILIDGDSNKYLVGDFLYDSSGSFINRGVFIQKRNSLSNIIWNKEFKDPDTLKSYFIRSASILLNSQIAVVGNLNFSHTDSVVVPGVPDADILLMIFDTSGNLQQQKRFGDNLSQDDGRSISVGGNNSILLGGQKKIPSTGQKSWIIETDYQGNFINEYVSTSNSIVGARDLIRTQDGGTVYISSKDNGSFFNPEYKIYVEKLDSNLNSDWIWESNIVYSQLNWGTSIDLDNHQNLLIGGRKYGYLFDPDTVGFYGFLQKLTPSGDSIWQREYGILNNNNIEEWHTFNDIYHIDNKTYMVGEVLDRANPIPPNQEMWLVSVDSNGVISNLQKDFTENHQILVYPNPTKDLLNIQYDHNSGEASFKLHDLQGRLQLNKVLDMGITSISLSGLPKGLYIYDIQINDQVIPIAKRRGKIVKE